ncbi:RNA-binding domain-containing protein [Deinococcus lacus]|uniref:RNA-binding domain-containing protein n=1 Tax=Deinococcus lacus TaxID=392561 RepID=A0ABW1YEV0_9DEIO
MAELGNEITSFEDVKDLREGYDFEAKKAAGQNGEGEVPKSLWETYSAMSNTEGGVIVLGLKEKQDGSFEGSGIRNTNKVLRDFWSTINDQRKVSACLLGEKNVQVIEYKDDSFLIVITVPRANRRSKPIYLNGNPFGNTFRRNHEGDYRCTEAEVRRMIADSEYDTRDDSILKRFTIDDFDTLSIAAYRNEFRSVDPSHPWVTEDDLQLLINMNAWRKDRETGEEGPTLAGILMFGKWNSILEAVKDYDVDYRDRTGDSERWSDRVHPDGRWSGNLYDFYRKAYSKLVSDLKMPFQIKDGRQRIDVTPVHIAIREALVNALVHADYSVGGGIVIEKLRDGFTFRNPGGLRLPKEQIMRGGRSDCRNLRLQLMFQHIGAGDKAGSGIPKILSAWKGQQWARPTIDETVQPESVILKMKMVSMFPEQTMASLDAKLRGRLHNLSDSERLILAIAEYEGEVHNRRLQQTLIDVHPRAITDLLNSLVDRGLLLRDWNSSWTTYHVADLRTEHSDVNKSSGTTGRSSNKTGKGRREPSSSPSLFDEIVVQAKTPMPIVQADSTTRKDSQGLASSQDPTHKDSQELRSSQGAEVNLPGQDVDLEPILVTILEVCLEAQSASELADALNLDATYLRQRYTSKLIKLDLLAYTAPRTSPNVKYKTTPLGQGRLERIK